MSENAAQAQQMPPVRTVPTWTPDSNITVKGFEWEAIQNSLGAMQMAMQAAQSVMSRNIVDGTIVMEFEKLNPQTLQYEAMPEEEKVPHREQFNKQIEAFKTAQAQQAAQPVGTPEAAGSTVTVQPDAPQANTASPETEAKPKKASKKAAKVVNLDGSK